MPFCFVKATCLFVQLLSPIGYPLFAIPPSCLLLLRSQLAESVELAEARRLAAERGADELSAVRAELASAAERSALAEARHMAER